MEVTIETGSDVAHERLTSALRSVGGQTTRSPADIIEELRGHGVHTIWMRSDGTVWSVSLTNGGAHLGRGSRFMEAYQDAMSWVHLGEDVSVTGI